MFFIGLRKEPREERFKSFHLRFSICNRRESYWEISKDPPHSSALRGPL